MHSQELCVYSGFYAGEAVDNDTPTPIREEEVDLTFDDTVLEGMCVGCGPIRVIFSFPVVLRSTVDYSIDEEQLTDTPAHAVDQSTDNNVNLGPEEQDDHTRLLNGEPR